MSKIYNEKKKISPLSIFFYLLFLVVNSEWYSVQVYGAVWRWRSETNMSKNPNQISGTVSHRLKLQNRGTVHPIVTFIQRQPIDTIFKKPQQKKSTLSQAVWHIRTLRHCAEVKSKTPHSRRKGKNHTFRFSKYIQCQHQCCQFWPLGLIIFPVFLKTRIMCSSWQMNTLNF